MVSGTIQPAAGEPPAPELVMTSTDLRKVYRCDRCGGFMIGVPPIHCKDGHLLPIRCFTYRKGGLFYAECLDLNLLTRGDSEEEAIGRLQEEMFAYVHTVLDGGSTEGLIPRKAPFLSWAKYYTYLLMDRLLGWLTRRRLPTRIHETFDLCASKPIRC